MFTFIISIIIILAVLLVLVVLAQNSKGGGLSSQFGGSSTSQLMGVKKTGDLLEKVTWGLAIGMLALSLSTSALNRTAPTGATSPNIERAREKSVVPGFSPNTEDGIDAGVIENDTVDAPLLPPGE